MSQYVYLALSSARSRALQSVKIVDHETDSQALADVLNFIEDLGPVTSVLIWDLFADSLLLEVKV